MKVCARCGVEKPLSEFYKVKYKGKEPVNTYTICKSIVSYSDRMINSELDRYLEIQYLTILDRKLNCISLTR